jgi:hypothetical protein
MQNALLHKAKDLRPGTRAAIEQELGRALQDNEEISITAYLPHDEPGEAVRRAAGERLSEHFNHFDERGSTASEETETAVLEALRNERPGYRERQ